MKPRTLATNNAGHTTLAFRGDGPFRASITRDLHDASLKVRLERLNVDALSYELVCEIAASEYAQVLSVLESIVASIPEASRAIRLGRGDLPWEAA